MAREQGRTAAGRVRRGDRLRVRGRLEDVKAVRNRSSAAEASVVLVLKSARAVRKRADETVSVNAPRTRWGWFR